MVVDEAGLLFLISDCWNYSPVVLPPLLPPTPTNCLWTPLLLRETAGGAPTVTETPLRLRASREDGRGCPFLPGCHRRVP